MDGNGRWAKQQGKARIFGHKNALTAVRETVETAAKTGVKYLTLYAFSTENWKRPRREIDALMQLLVTTINKEIKNLNENDIRLRAIGELATLPEATQRELAKGIEATKNNKRMDLVLALSYSSRWEITQAVKQIAEKVKAGDLFPSDINENTIEQHLATAGMPDPELIIRTSGEIRISNFLLWQAAYAELVFMEKLWPDFRGVDLIQAIACYQTRERRFGKTSAQLRSSK